MHEKNLTAEQHMAAIRKKRLEQKHEIKRISTRPKQTARVICMSMARPADGKAYSWVKL